MAADRRLETDRHLTGAPDSGLHLAQVAAAESPEGLAAVLTPHVNLAVFTRALDSQLQTGVERFGAALRESLAVDLAEFNLESETLAEALHTACASAIQAEPQSTARRELSAVARDAAELARSFARIARDSAAPRSGRAPGLRLRLDRVENDMYRAFHTDCYRMRLICTYRGGGTEWTPDDNVNRQEFYSLPAAERLLDPQRVFRLRTGWVAILKGECFPGAEGRAVVHRSPPANPQEWRLVMRIDCD